MLDGQRTECPYSHVISMRDELQKYFNQLHGGYLLGHTRASYAYNLSCEALRQTSCTSSMWP
eukprot:scaffold392767_cov31-Prasinocladus_malaysianus.AAC.1